MASALSKEFLDTQENYSVWIHSETFRIPLTINYNRTLEEVVEEEVVKERCDVLT